MGIRAFSGAAVAVSSLLLATGAGATTIFADGSALGVASGSGTNWSSDLGQDDFYGVFPDSINHGPGGTSPLRAQGTLFSQESVTNFTGPLENFGGSTGILSASATLDVAFGGPGQVVDGKVNHVRFDESVPTIGGYGMFVNSTMVADTFLYGGVADTPTFVYWAYQWRMSTDLPAGSHLSADYLIDIGNNTSGGRIEVGGVAPGNFGGSAFGVFQLRGGDTPSTINTGYGLESSRFSFALGNGAGSGAPHGGSAAFDAWFEFSSTPIDHVTFPTSSGVPEPAGWSLMILGLGGVGGSFRRRRQAATAASSCA